MKRRYVVVYEKSGNNYGASAPDVPGCGSVGDTWEEMQAMIQEALEIHLDLTAKEGDPIPEPTRSAIVVEA